MALTWTNETIIARTTKVAKPHIDDIRAYLNGHIYQHTQGGSLGIPPGNLAHPLATTTTPGFMSAADKVALENVVAASSGIQSVAVSSPLIDTNANANIVEIEIPAANPTTNGYMTAAYAEKLENIDLTHVISDITAESPINIAINGSEREISIDNASQTSDGLLSKEDKRKIDTMAGIIGEVKMLYIPNQNEYNLLFDQYGKGRPNTKVDAWAICNGASYEIAPGVYFATPDMRERVAVGAGLEPCGTTTYKLTIGTTVYDIEGEKAHILTEDEVAEHDHAYTSIVNGTEISWNYMLRKPYGGSLTGYDVQGSGWEQAVGAGDGAASLKKGKSYPHNNMPPFRRLYYIIKIKD